MREKERRVGRGGWKGEREKRVPLNVVFFYVGISFN